MGKKMVVEIDIGLAGVKHHAVTVKDERSGLFHGFQCIGGKTFLISVKSTQQALMCQCRNTGEERTTNHVNLDAEAIWAISIGSCITVLKGR